MIGADPVPRLIVRLFTDGSFGNCLGDKMAILPVKCSSCGKTVSVRSEMNGVTCPECGGWLSIVKAMKEQHPKWLELDNREKELNERYHFLENCADDYESGSAKTKRFFRRYIYLIIALFIDVIFIAVSGLGFDESFSIGNVAAIVLMIGLLVVTYFLPEIIKKIRKDSDAKSTNSFVKEEHEKLAKKLSEVMAEKEAYMKEIGAEDNRK